MSLSINRFKQAGLLASATWFVFPGGAYAQVATTPAAQAVGTASVQADSVDIIVTAQKRSERLLDVPVAITAVSAETLTQLNVARLSDFYDRIPGLQYSGQRVANISLRGITTAGQTAPTVAILVDDVQFGGTTGIGQPPLPDFDASAISRVEVLRGPQGTLYGAASLGGLIKYVLKDPDLSRVSGRVEAAGTSVSHGGEGYALRGSLNVPVTDWIAVSASAFKRDDAAYLDNANPTVTKKKDVNTRDVWGYRGAVLIKPSDNLRIVASALYQKMNALNSDLTTSSGGVPICVACTTGANASTAPTTFEPVYGDLTIRSLDAPNDAKFYLYTARAEWDIGSVKATSISAWSRSDNVVTSDVTQIFGGLLRNFYGVATTPSVQIANADQTNKFSQEFRLSGDIGAFSWLAGGFYTVENAATNQTILASGSITGTPYIGKGPGRYREIAGFGDVTWHVTDKLDIQVGGRYAGNKQNNATTLVLQPQVEGVFGDTGTTVASSKDEVFTWLVSPSYHFSRDILGYVRVASGYRPGGPNIASPPGAPTTFGPDRVINYEVGFKGKVIPGLLTIDTALFQIDWKDIQLQGTDPITSLTFLANGGKARSRGLEFAANLTPWRGMSVDGSMTLTEATITESILTLQGGAGFVGRPGDRLPFTAKFAANLSAQQTFDVGDAGQAYLGGSITHLGNRPAAFQTNSSSASRPRILIPSYTTVDLRAGFTFKNGLSVGPYIRNVFDERGIASAQNRNGANVPTALFIQPRTFGIVVGFGF